ncbi:MAG: hypothetical protein PQJ47_05960 [Sphaerochaetaceae bacterium]|nr:hypothetical protein [Sphaerochaetaceae bacterium]
MCLDDQILNTYLDGELVEPWKTQVEEHLKYCTACSSRFRQLQAVHEMVCSSRLSDEKIDAAQEKILAFMENKYLHKEKKVKFLHRDFTMKTPTIIGIAAAFVLIFIGAFTIQSPSLNDSNVLIPQVVDTQSGNVTQVSSIDSLTTDQILSNLSLEEILSYLDSKGFEVDLKVKSVNPIGESTD